jgi:hypothetical protein
MTNTVAANLRLGVVLLGVVLHLPSFSLLTSHRLIIGIDHASLGRQSQAPCNGLHRMSPQETKGTRQLDICRGTLLVANLPIVRPFEAVQHVYRKRCYREMYI